MSQAFRRVMISLVAAVALASCSTSDANTAQQAPASEQLPASDGPIVGIWLGVGEGMEASEMEFFRDGTYHYRNRNGVSPGSEGKGRYELGIGSVTLITSDPFGFYAWSLAGGELIYFLPNGTPSVRFRRGAPDSLRAEAEAQAKKYWDSSLSKCGEFYATTWKVPGRIYFQQKAGVTFWMKPDLLSQADRLNGVEWRGVSTADGTAAREYIANASNPDQYPKIWGEWRPPVPWRVGLEKKGSGWIVREQAALGPARAPLDLEPLACEEVRNP